MDTLYAYWPGFKGSQLCLSLFNSHGTVISSSLPCLQQVITSLQYYRLCSLWQANNTSCPLLHLLWFCQIPTEADRENLYNKLMWFTEKICIIADICLVELYEPNYFYFASVSKSRLWELSWSCEPHFFCVYYLCITKVGQTQQRLCSIFSKQSHCQVFGGKCRVAIGCLWVSFQHALSLETQLLRRCHFLPRLCLKVTVVVAPI